MPQQPKSIEQINQYCQRDTEIVLKAIQTLRQKLNTDNITIKRMYTVSQIAISYILYQLKANNPELFHKGQIQCPYYHHQVRNTYRYGRLQAFKTGTYQNITSIDINSLYPYAAIKMRYPDITTERFIKEPLKYYNIHTLLGTIGITKCIIKNEKDNLGLIQIRLPDNNHILQKGQTGIGIWTNQELQTATENGHTILNIEFSILYEQTKNPLTLIYNRLYQKRLETDNKYDKHFYKQIMNHSIGKFAQKSLQTQMIIDNIEKTPEYLQNGYEPIKNLGYNNIYLKETNQEITLKNKKKHYNPLIPAIINADSRIYLYKYLKKFQQENLLYTDTDSIIYRGKTPNIPLSEQIGHFKVEHTLSNITIYGQKTYIINDIPTISGVSKHAQVHNDKAIQTQQQTIFTTQDQQQWGTFRNITRDLKQQLFEHREKQINQNNQTLLIDTDYRTLKPINIDHFLPLLNSIQQ